MTARDRYIVAEAEGGFAVCFVRADHPDWWQVIARFASRDRAVSYAEIENDMTDYADGERDPDVSVDPPRLLPPPSRLPDLRPHAPAELPAESEEPLAPPGESESEGDDAQEEPAPPPEAANADDPALPEAAEFRSGQTHPVGPDGLKPREREIWRLLAEKIFAGYMPTRQEIRDSTGLGLAHIGKIYNRLEELGFIRRSGVTNKVTIEILRWPDGIDPPKPAPRGPTAEKPPTAPKTTAPARIISAEPEPRKTERDRPIMDGSLGASRDPDPASRGSSGAHRGTKQLTNIRPASARMKDESTGPLNPCEPRPMTRPNRVSVRQQCSRPACKNPAQQNREGLCDVHMHQVLSARRLESAS